YIEEGLAKKQRLSELRTFPFNPGNSPFFYKLITIAAGNNELKIITKKIMESSTGRIYLTCTSGFVA
ncbi:hypothetical protein ACFL1G_04840, partial [Planctomycetota bacterium]